MTFRYRNANFRNSCSASALSAAIGYVTKSKKEKRQGKRREYETRAVHFEALEPRLLLSADFMPVHGSIDVPGETDQFTFNISENTRIYFDALTSDGQLAWTLTGPRGSEVPGIAITNSDGPSGSATSALDLVAGDYTLSVTGAADATGSYSFRLLDVATATPITSGTPVSGTLSTGTETALYRFDAQAGEKFFFDQQSNSGGAVYWRLIDPFDRTVWSNWFQNGDVDVQALAFTGSYTLAIEGYVYNTAPASFDFAVQKVTDTTAALTVGATVDGAIAHAGQQNRYTFDLASAKRLCFDSLTNTAPNLSWRLIGPRGEVNSTPFSFSSSDGPSGTPLLDLAAGSYTLIVDGYFDATGPYRFRLLDVATATPIALGDPVSGTLPSGNETALYRFDAAAGDQILLNRQALSAGSPYWRLIDPYGGQVYANSFADSSTLTLRLTGTYTLLFEGQIAESGALQYTFNVTSEGHVDLPAPTGTVLVLDATTTGAIGTADEEDNYVFDITQPTQLLFDALTNSGLSWSLIGPLGEMVSARYFMNSDSNFGSDPVITLKIPGTYQLRVQGSGSTGSYSFRLLDIATATPIASGTPVSGMLPTGRETVLYRFDAQAGEKFFFDQLSNSGGTNWRLIDPFGRQVWYNGYGDRDVETLAFSGSYTLAIEGYVSNASPVDFSFAVQKVQDTTAALTVGATVSGAIAHAGQQNRYTFDLASAKRLYFDSLTNSGLSWSLIGPRGEEVSSRYFSSSDAGYYYSGNPVLDLSAGSYTLIVDGSGDEIGSYSFRLLDVATAMPITSGTPVSGTLPSGKETALYRFDAQAGEKFFFDQQSSSGGTVFWRLVDPFGRQVWFNGFGDQDVQALAFAGTYTLAIEGSLSNASPVDFSFAVQKVEDTTAALAVGTTVDGTIGHAGQENRYTFDLAGAARLYFDSLTNSNSSWSLIGPRGEEVSTRYFSSSDAASFSSDPMLDLSAGSYTLIVDGYGDETGSYSFRLLDIATATPITSGTPVSGTLSTGTETALYRFDAQAGEKFFFDQQSSSGGTVYSVYWRLIDPFGRQVWVNGFGDQDVQALAFTGSYTLAIEGYVSNASSVDFSFAVQKVEDTTAALAVGTTVDGTIGHAGQENRYTFDLAGVARLYFDSLTSDPYLTWRLIGPRGELNSTPIGFSYSDGPGTPLLDLVAGSYTLIVDGYLDTTGPYSFRLLDLSTATPITLGDPVSGTLPSGNETALYRFDATAGDQVLLNRQALSAGSPYWRLIDPYGGQFYASYFTDSPTLTLPLAGTYTLLFEGQIAESGALQYTFNVTSEGHVDLPAPTGTGLVLGATTTGAIDTVGEEDNYVFNVTQSTQLLFDALTNSGLTWSLIGPQGEVVAARAFTNSDSANFGSDPVITLKIPGTYQLRIQSSASSVGSYSFRLLDVATAAPITSGTPVSGTLPTGTETALYRFDAQAGEKFFFDQQSNSGGTVYWRLIDPFGRQVWINGFGDQDVQALAFSGTYTLAIEGYVYNTVSASFTFAVQKVQDTTAALTVGATVSGAIAHAGQQNRYTFDLASAKRLYFDSLTNSGLSWSLIGPRGEEVSSRYFSSSDAGYYYSGNPVLDLSAGSYTLIVDGNLDMTGSYSFRLLDVATAMPITSGTPMSGALPTGKETLLYRFDAQAGEKFFFDQQSSSGGTVYWRLVDPFGRQVWFNGFGDQDVQALAFAGTYTLAIEGYVNNTEPAAFTFSIFHVPVSEPVPIANQEAVPAPDLEVTDIVVSPATGWLPGSTVGLTWNTTNIGNLATSGSWTEQIRVRNLSTGQIIRLDSIAFDAGVEGLALGDSRPRQYNFVWPSGLAGSGEFIFEIATDSANQVSESNALGTAESNNTAQVAIASAPDLKILDLHVTSAEVQAGGALVIEWSDANTGALPATTGWFTQIAIVNTATGETVLNTAISYDPVAPGNAPLGAGQTRPRSVTLQLPHGSRGAGTLEIHVTADSNQNGIGTIIEAAEGVNAEANNSAVLEIISQPRLYPDLEASNMSAPSSGQGGGTVTVDWTVTNIGPVDTGVSSWKDTIILSRDSVWGNEDDVEVASFTRTGALAPDASYTRQETVTLPQRLDGTFLLTVRTDATGAVTEPDTLSNNVAVPVTIDLQSPAADLVVEAVVGPLTGRSGELIDLSWRVRNQGEATDVTVWTDRIVLSADEVVDATDRILANVVHTGALAKDGTYAGRATVRLPDGLQGSFHLLLITDAEARVYERDATANNIGQSLTTIAVSAAPAADLVVTGVVAPASGVPGQHKTVTWTVRNDGEGGARAPWTDRVYLSKDGTLATAIVIGEVRRVFDLAVGTSYVGTVDVTLPDAADDTYQILVVTDANQEVYEVDRETNNALGSSLALSHPDLTTSNVQAPATIVSGSVMPVRWNVRNNGTGAALGSWTDAIYLSRDDVIDAEDIKLADVPHVGGLDIDGEYLGEATVAVPLSASGDYKLIVVSDQLDTVREPQAEANNLASSSLHVTLAPYADLSVGSVSAPALTIGDPARVTIGWTVTNQGTGVGQTLAWTDTIIGSRDEILGNSDDMVLAEFRHDGAVAVGGSYDRSEQIMLPAALSERFTLFVRTDSKSEVFENGSEANNAATPGHPVDVVPIPYADLTVTDLVADASAQSGGRLNVSWTVKNQGVGVTDRDQWTDTITLIDASGQAVADARFDHLGILANDASYTRSAQIVLPNGLSGPYRLVATTGGVYEFVFTDNNARTSDTIEVTLAPSPDLTVTDVKVPASAIEGDTIDVSWTVTNNGQGVANGTWSDRIVLRPLAGTNLPDLQVGTFSFSGELAPGKSYTRTEQFRLPDKIEGLYRAFVVTNALLPTTDEATLPEPSYFLYEHGAAATNNNTGDDGTLAVQLKPRADLQVEAAIVPARVPAGGTASVKFTIINQGTVPTTSRWKDSVYLSLDNQVDAGDMLVGTYDNLLALDPGGRYTKETGPIEIPIRFRRDAYLIVRTDSADQVEEYPNDANNTRAFAFFVEPEPLSDLVTGSVVAPVQAVAGSQIEVRFTVTNKGSSSTNKDTWSDSVWLTKDRTRPSPSKNGGILLGSIQHSGALPVGQSYDQVLKVTLPDDLESGIYFITPWSDSYDVVLEDTLAVNVNADDPSEFDNNNYKARQIQVLGPETITQRPDLKVLSVSGPTQIDAAGQYTVKWTVGNAGPGDTGDVGWVERIWISDRPTLGEVGAKEWLLESLDRSGGLAVGETATSERTYDLSPAIQGHFLIVDVDAGGAVPETNELNNNLVVASEVIRHPADLRVTRIEVPAQNFSGEKTTINWTVTNAGADVWPDTAYWIDSVFFSRDPVWNPDIQISSAAITPQRTQLLATSVHSNQGGLRAGESYNASAEVVLPPGIDGPFYVFVLTDVVPTGKAPKEEFDEAKGGDDQIREYYLESVFEGANNTNNISRQDISVTYREPDLQVSSLAVPATAISGDRVTVSWHVLNAGTRETRQDAWVDRVFLSRDGSLDTGDYELGSFQHNGKLAIGAAYTALLDVDLPEFIDGDFHIIVETDARSERATTTFVPSTIALDLPGLQIASDTVPEFQGEGNNATGKALPITLRVPPDLKVSSVTAPQHVTAGQPFDFSFTVLNAGSGDVRTSQDSWTDLVYLSRDQHLDLESDRFIGAYEHTGGLAAGQSYTLAKSIRAPVGLEGSYYLFVVTDPISATGRSSVFEANLETNNAKSSDQPLVFELPPPSDLVVDNNVATPSVAKVGDTLQISWTVRNQGVNPAEGTWTDGVYLSDDAIWDINDRLLKLVPFTGSLLTNDTYTVSIPADLPPAKAGQYRLIVRSDIYNEVYEGPFNAESEKNNAAPSVNTLSVSVDEMHLGVPLQTTLSTGQVRVYRITVPQGETLKVRLTGSDSNASNELFLRYGDVPTGFLFDAIYQDPLQATQTAVIPATKAGEYYVLIRGHQEPSEDTAVTLLAEVAPFAISRVEVDRGGDSRWVTFDVFGAKFATNAIVKLVRPGIAEYEPVRYDVLDSTHIKATFDFTDAPHGLYDVKVINPDGTTAIEPYRYLIERALEPDVTIGLGGPRVLLAGDTGTYGIAFQSHTNVDTPYTFLVRRLRAADECDHLQSSLCDIPDQPSRRHSAAERRGRALGKSRIGCQHQRHDSRSRLSL
ncbi:LEPR-XLL domain-containing protein [Mesorhizobium sp. M0615]|uniref:CARDB domain-containing protein n=1 Tax=Mesorhizobium sp. M0615 TaxID=2956971 RepID=UPI00333D0D99